MRQPRSRSLADPVAALLAIVRTPRASVESKLSCSFRGTGTNHIVCTSATDQTPTLSKHSRSFNVSVLGNTGTLQQLEIPGIWCRWGLDVSVSSTVPRAHAITGTVVPILQQKGSRHSYEVSFTCQGCLSRTFHDGLVPINWRAIAHPPFE